MSWFNVFLLSIVEGFSEFLPISSTGHMIITGFFFDIPSTEFVKSFMIIVQLGAILSVLTKYWKVLIFKREYWPKLIASTIPTVIIGLLLYSVEKKYLLGNVLVTAAGLFFGGLGLIFIEKLSSFNRSGTKEIASLTTAQAALIGIAQSLAIIPGVSRSAATVVAGMFFGLDRKESVELSFLLALPIMAGATGLDLVKTGFNFSSLELMQLMLGMIVAFIVARLSVNWLVSFVESHSMAAFGWYRLVLAAVVVVKLFW